ncbi:hypothetical protein BD779DRAFT_1470361 [Infundibulicybe gibba]|nr:hypothetical protein BD779DRAFT_1470361 [Infundibulicybe gibba]
MPIPRIGPLTNQNLNIPRPPAPADPPTERDAMRAIQYRKLLNYKRRCHYVTSCNRSITRRDIVVACKYENQILASYPPSPAAQAQKPDLLTRFMEIADRLEVRMDGLERRIDQNH